MPTWRHRFFIQNGLVENCFSRKNFRRKNFSIAFLLDQADFTFLGSRQKIFLLKEFSTKNVGADVEGGTFQYSNSISRIESWSVITQKKCAVLDRGDLDWWHINGVRAFLKSPCCASFCSFLQFSSACGRVKLTTLSRYIVVFNPKTSIICCHFWPNSTRSRRNNYSILTQYKLIFGTPEALLNERKNFAHFHFSDELPKTKIKVTRRSVCSRVKRMLSSPKCVHVSH